MSMKSQDAFLRALAVSEKHIDDVLRGITMIEGKPCTIKSIESIDGGQRVTFQWTADDGTTKTQTMDVMDGIDGADGQKGDKGDPGVGLPEGGTVGQVLVKKSSTDYDMEWDTPGGGGDMLKSVYDTDNDGKVNSAENADTVGGHTVARDVPADAKFTDTVYDDTEIREEIADKVDKVSGKGLSTEDYTSEEKTKLAGVEASAEVNTIESITLNGTEVTPDANKNVALTVITNTVNNLVNYYLKSETYTKTEVDNIVTVIKNSRFEVVATLPTTDIKTNVIYLVPKSPSQTSNVKDEYINLDGTTAGWEEIGDTEIDLSNYVTTQALNTALADYTTTADLTTLLAGKQDTLTFDDAPTENSDNPVKSGGVYSANQNIYEVMGQMGAKNLITYPHSGKTETKAGITFTENADGSVTVNGTATEIVRHLISSQQFEVGKKYILSGCPSGGSHSLNGTYTLYTQTVQNYDDGEGVEFTWDASITGITIAVFAGVTVDNLTFYPMIRLASDTDSTYQPYAKTNKELTDDAEALAAKVNSLKEHTGTYLAEVGTKEGSALAKIIYGMSVQDGTPTPDSPVEIQSAKADFRCTGKNLIPYPYYRQSGYSAQGMTGTYGDDGIITINKNAGSATAYFGLYSGDKVLIPNTRYKLSMSLENTNNASVYISVNNIDIAAIRNKASGNYEYTFTTPNELLGTTAIGMYFAANDVESNCKVKVMLTLADADQTYEPNQHTDVTTNLTLRSIEVASTDDYNLVRDGKYYIADTIDWSEDEGYQITRRIKKIIYNGTESWITNVISGNRHAFFKNLSDNVPPKTQNDVVYAVSSHFSATSRNNLINNTVTNIFGQNASTLDIMFIPSDTSITTVAQWKTWLESNNLTVEYILATPTTESITSEQAQALLSLKTYDEASYISSTGSVEPSVDLEYAKSEMGAKALTGHNEAYIAQELEGVYGVKNLIPYPYYEMTKTANGITFTVNEDGSVTVNGTATATAQFGLISRTSSNYYIKNGTYTLSGCPNQNGLQIRIGRTVNGADSQYGQDTGNGLIVNRTDEEKPIGITIQVNNGTTVNNLTFKPMLRPASIQSDEYQPYAMSNYELTKKIKELETALIELSSQ